MSVPTAYGLAILIWSTTPLAIVYSNESLPPMMAAFLRMFLAAILGSLLLRFLKYELCWHWPAVRAYLVSVIGVFGAMGSTYLAAQWIPSGLISVLFGLTTIFTGVLGHYFTSDGRLSFSQWLAVFTGLAGLSVVFTDQLVVTGQGVTGVMLVLLAVSLFSVSNILMKRYGGRLHPLQQTVGALWVSLPFYIVACLVTGSWVFTSDVTLNSVAGVVYLAILGSLVGFMAYFHLIANLPPAYVALITLVTPVIALFLGSHLRSEPITVEMVAGTGIILMSLLIFMGEHFFRLFSERGESRRGREKKERENPAS